MMKKHFLEVRDEVEDNGSEQSLLAVMNEFVQTVKHMDDTVMIPSRLRDIQADDVNVRQETVGLPLLSKECKQDVDLYNFYQMINTVKNELLLVPKDVEELGLERRPASEIDGQDRTAETFRHHITGLFHMLKYLTDGANYLAVRYQEGMVDFDSASSSKVASSSPYF